MVFDENDRWLEDAADIAESGLDIVPFAALASAGGTRIPLDIDARVSPGVPTSDAGRLGVANEVDRYVVTIPTDEARALRPREPCSGAQVFSVLLGPDRAPPVERALSCGVPVPLPSGELTSSVFSHGGDTGPHAFDIVEPATTNIGLVAPDTVIEGDLTVDERLVATLPGVEGRRIFIATRRKDDCGRHWELVDADGAVIERTSVCLDLGLHVLEDAAPYGLRIQPGPGVEFGFTVLSVDADTTDRVDGETRFELIVSTPGQQASATFALSQGERGSTNALRPRPTLCRGAVARHGAWRGRLPRSGRGARWRGRCVLHGGRSGARAAAHRPAGHGPVPADRRVVEDHERTARR